MNRFPVVFLLLVLASATGWSESIRVASWNLQNFLLQNRYEHGRFRFAYPKPEMQKAGIRELLVDIRPDVLFIQEIGSDALLVELQRDLAADGLDYQYRHCAIVPEGRSGLGVLSRIPLDEVVFHHPVPVPHLPDEDTWMPRGLQEVRFSVAGHCFLFFHLHLKSRYTSDPRDPRSEIFRAREIISLQEFLHPRVASLPEDTSIFLVGDFNTPFSSPLLNPLCTDWFPVPAADNDGQDWTYSYHRTNALERIDGFWCPPGQQHQIAFSASVLPPAIPFASDHRLVLLDLSP